MKYTKRGATARQILDAAKAFQAASDIVWDTIVKYQGAIKRANTDACYRAKKVLDREAFRLEDDFADLVAKEYGVPVRSVPFFGCTERLEECEEFLRKLEGKV